MDHGEKDIEFSIQSFKILIKSNFRVMDHRARKLTGNENCFLPFSNFDFLNILIILLWQFVLSSVNERH